MSTDLAVIEAALKAATPGPWAVKEINLGAIGTQDDVLWPWVFATNPMPIPAAHGATTGPLIADLSRRHEEDPEDGIDYAHGGIASIETTDGNYPERDAADANLIANAPAWLAELVERVRLLEGAIDGIRSSARTDRFACCACCLEDHDADSELVNNHTLPCNICQDPWKMRAEAAEAAIERVRALHVPHVCRGDIIGRDACFITHGGRCSNVGTCAVCFATEFPCDTIRALDAPQQPASAPQTAQQPAPKGITPEARAEHYAAWLRSGGEV